MVVELSVQLDVPVTKAFQAWTLQLGKWWSSGFLIGGEGASLHCEPSLGGRVYEKWPSKGSKIDAGSLWGIVTEIQKDSRLEITGALGMPGVVQGKLGLDFESTGTRSCTLTLRHAAIGEVDQEVQEGYEAGWDYLIDQCLRPYLD